MLTATADVHNETVNIHSHSIGALFFAILLPLHVMGAYFPTLGVFPGSSAQPPTTVIDKICLATYCVSAVTCMGLSSWFHTVQCCSQDVCDLAHCGDYVSYMVFAVVTDDNQVGIVVLIVGSILPGMYYGFHDNPVLRYVYMGKFETARLSQGTITDILYSRYRDCRCDCWLHGPLPSPPQAPLAPYPHFHCPRRQCSRSCRPCRSLQGPRVCPQQDGL